MEETSLDAACFGQWLRWTLPQSAALAVLPIVSLVHASDVLTAEVDVAE